MRKAIAAGLVLGIVATLAAYQPATASTSTDVCTGDGTLTDIQANMKEVAGGSPLDHSSPANLVANGDFTEGFSTLFASGGDIFWGANSLRRVLDNSIDYNLWGVRAPVQDWMATGGGPDTYARWWDMSYNYDGGSREEWFDSHPTLDNAYTGDISPEFVYFGNWKVTTTTTADGLFGVSGDATATSPESTFTGHVPNTGQLDWATNPPTSYDADYGALDEPVTLSQVVTLEPGRTYRLSFLQGGEHGGDRVTDGLAGLDITGYDRTYFRIYHGGNRYMFEFTATQSDTTIAFMNWGHLYTGATESYELSLDDVIINDCGIAPASASSSLAQTGISSSIVMSFLTAAAFAIGLGLVLTGLRRRLNEK